jgi:membrane protein DedA with SNARE-associated domain
MDMTALVTLPADFGPLGLAAVAFAEKLLPVIPSYAILIFLGMTTVSDGGDLVATLLATSLGSTVGSLCWYGLGRSFGPARSEALMVRFGRYVRLSPSLYQRMTEAYRRNHFWVTLVGQTIPAVRVYLSVPAGVLGLAPVGFLAASWLGSMTWNMPLLALGYALRGSGADPASVGLLTIAGLLALEMGLIGACHLVRRLRLRGPAAAARRDEAF